MFHRFSATPAKASGQTKGSGSTRSRTVNKKHTTTSTSSSNKARDGDSEYYIAGHEHKILPAKRQKAARACDHCRLHRIKCDEQKPCAQCVGIKAKCIVSYGSPGSPGRPGSSQQEQSSQANKRNANVGPARSESTSVPCPPPTSLSPSPPHIRQQSSWAAATCTPPDAVSNENFNIPHIDVDAVFADGQPAFSHNLTSVGSDLLFPQLPHPAVPSGKRPPPSNALSKTQQRYYLRLFWDAYHPLLQIMSETEFAELDALPPLTVFDEYTTRNALVDSMLALGIQHSHTTGLAGRILGLQQPPSQQCYHAAPSPSPETSWPGFEYFDRCREFMRANTEVVTLETLRCHALMVIYFMKGNAFRDAYNLLGIAVRRAYIAKLHRLPRSHLPESQKTAHMQLWWMLFSLDLQCSLQLGMPAASQKSLVKCPFPNDDDLARYVSPCSHREERLSPFMYTTRLVNLAVIVTDIAACFSTADLDEDDRNNNPATFEHIALKLSSTLQDLEVWHDQLPSELRLDQGGNGCCSGSAEGSDFDCSLSLLLVPVWLQRQRVLLELHYHNAYNLIQRPFIRIRCAHSSVASGTITPPDSRHPQTEQYIASALHHASMVVDTVFTVCSTSEVLYGWSEVLQPLWNAAMTITAYVYANSLSSVVPRALDSLTRAQTLFEFFSSTCPSARSAKGFVQSLASSLQSMVSRGPNAIPNDDPMGWDLFASLLDEQTFPSGLEGTSLVSDDICGDGLFSPLMPSASQPTC